MPITKFKKCIKCKQEINASAKVCEHCNSKQGNWFLRHKLITIFILFPITMGMIANAIDDLDNSRQKSAVSKNQTPITKDNDTIPGMSAVDVYGNLKKLGFTCDGPDVFEGRAFWECKEETNEHLFSVEILGNSATEILSVQATALNYSNKQTDSIAKDFLGYVASIPYENSKQANAKDWVIKNVSQNTNTVISGVRFTMVENDRSRILTIANENSNLD